MALEIILLILGIFITAIGIWNVVNQAVAWGIVFIAGGIWAIWLSITYIRQLKKINESDQQKKTKQGEEIKPVEEVKTEAEEVKPAEYEESSKKHQEKVKQTEEDEEVLKARTDIPEYGSGSVENAVISDEESEEDQKFSEDPVDAEYVTNRMIVQDFIEDQYSSQKKDPEDDAEEINPEVIIDDPEPIRYAEAEFVEEKDEDED